MGANRSQVPLCGVASSPPSPSVKSGIGTGIGTGTGTGISLDHRTHRPAARSSIASAATSALNVHVPTELSGVSYSASRSNVGLNNRPLAGSKTRSMAHAPTPPLDATESCVPSGTVEIDNPDGASDAQSDRDRDSRPDGQSGKKRKVPSSLQTLGRDEAARDLDGRLHEDAPFDEDVPDTFDVPEPREDGASNTRLRTNFGEPLWVDNGDTGDREDGEYSTAGIATGTTTAFPRKGGKWTLRDPVRSSAAQACAWRKALFLKRKAALITLFLDAQTAINSALTKPPGGKAGAKDKSLILPEVAVFEQMMPALEDVGVGQWPLDQPGWRTGVEVKDETKVYVEKWKSLHEQRRKEKAARKRVVRGGWAPEGSFEFEVNSKASRTAQARAKDHAALRKLIVELRGVTLNATKLASVQKTHAQIQDKTHQTKEPAKPAVSGQIETLVTTNAADKENVPMSSTNSSHGSEETTTGKKKQKKKKRSVLANQSNPHHVDNYRPSRIPGTHGDPLEPWPWHDNLLFPPSMAFLSARPASKAGGKHDDVLPDAAGVVPMTVRPSEDEYLCTFCEYALYYGTEAERKRAIRMRRRELKRKQTIKNRAKNVAEGKGKGNLGREEEDEEWDEEEGCEGEEGGCQGRCSCGRPINSDGSKEKKPPDKDGTHEHHHHHHHHHHTHDHHDHHDHHANHHADQVD